jgi:hypothetical protein
MYVRTTIEGIYHARLLNMPEMTVKTNFYRSRARLRRILMNSTHFAAVS